MCFWDLATVRLFDRAGFKVLISERSYVPSIDDPELEAMVLRASAAFEAAAPWADRIPPAVPARA